jgi:large subunit ribosomal protein L9
MASKLLLVEDVEELGRQGDLVEVRPGYARNFLLPQGKAVVADARTIRMQAKLQEERRQRAIEDRKESEKVAALFVDLVIETVVNTDQEGKMYGSVTASDVVDLLRDQHKLEIEKRFVLLKHPIKELGSHVIQFRLKEGVEASCVLNVESRTPLQQQAQQQAQQ